MTRRASQTIRQGRSQARDDLRSRTTSGPVKVLTYRSGRADEAAVSCRQLNGISARHGWGRLPAFGRAAYGVFQNKIEAIEVQQKIVYDTNRKPESDHAIEGRTRNCLVCRKQFFSAWSGQRICQGCKSTAAWRSGVLK